MNLTYKQVITNAKDYFAKNHNMYNVLGNDYFTAIQNPVLAEEYVEALTAGMGANSAAQTAQLIKNNNEQILSEAQMSGLSPIYGLSNPNIRMLFPKIHLKEAVKTIVAETPHILTQFILPYIEKADSNGKPVRYYLPYQLEDARSTEGDLSGSYVAFNVLMTVDGTAGGTAAQVVSYDVWAKHGATMFANIASQMKFQPLDSDFVLNSVTVGSKTISLNARPMLMGGMINVDYADAEDTVAGKLFLNIDFNTDVVVVSAIPTKGAAPTAVKCTAHFTTENHEKVVSTSVHNYTDETNIGSKDHYSATVTSEFLTDFKCLTKIDGVEELTSTLSKLVELELDKRIFKFIANSFTGQPGKLPMFQHLGNNTKRFATFNLKQSVTFAGGQRAWRDDIRPIIDDLAARIEIATYLEDGIYNVVCNPKDAQIINNIDWKVRGQSSTVDGVSVSYSVGNYQGSHSYRVIASPQVTEGYVYILFIPSSDNQLTYVYRPFTLVLESNYRDPNHIGLPALMTTKRDALDSYLPAIACIQILNNGSDVAGYDTYRDVLPMTTVTGDAAEADAAVFTTTVPSGK